jgi:hypothetical protein
VFGAISFLPYAMSSSPPPSLTQQSLFVLVVSAVCMLAAWFGLRMADATYLPMPFLRRLDLQLETPPGGGLVYARESVLFAGCKSLSELATAL